jgi:indolepyruvate ferredoxin oxidoreductase alpha subunit
MMSYRALDAQVAGDIGCYTLAAIEPLRSIDTCVSMGSSIAIAAGRALATAPLTSGAELARPARQQSV